MGDIKVNKESTLKNANIPESWWDDCCIADNGMIFTPKFSGDGKMIATGEDSYNEWKMPQPPSFPQPTAEERIIAAQQTITSLDLALIAAEQSITDNDLRLLALEAAA